MAKSTILTVVEVAEKLSVYEFGCLIGWLRMWLEDAPVHHRTHAHFLEWLAVEQERWENTGGKKGE